MNVFLSNELLDVLGSENVNLGFEKFPYNQIYNGPEKDCDVFAFTVNGAAFWPISPSINLLTGFEGSKIDYDASTNRFSGNLPEQVDYLVDIMTYMLNDYGEKHNYGKEFHFNDERSTELKAKLMQELDQEYNVLPNIEISELIKNIWSGTQYDTWYDGVVMLNDRVYDFNCINGDVAFGNARFMVLPQSEIDWINNHKREIDKQINKAVREEEENRKEKYHKKSSPIL